MKIRVKPCKVDCLKIHSSIFNKNTFLKEVLKDGVEIVEMQGVYETLNKYKNHSGSRSLTTVKFYPYTFTNDSSYYISKE